MAAKSPPDKSPIEPHNATDCKGCGRLMFMVINPNSQKAGPLDPRATVYVTRREWMSIADPMAETQNQFLDQVEFIQMKDGKKLAPEDVHFYVTHFATCPKAGQFSSRNRR